MRRIAMAVALACVCGCGGDTAGPSTGAELGSYSLVSLDGRAVPTSITDAGHQIEVLSGALVLSTGQKLRLTTTARPSPGATPVSNEVTGTYSLKGNTFTFTYSNGGRNTGTLSGNTIQMLNEGVAWLFRKS